MTRRTLDPALFAELASVDTPTICNAIEAFKQRDDSEGFMGARVRCLTPELGVMAGYAVTATCDSMTPGQPRRREPFMALWETLAAAPKPAVLVFQDVSPAATHSVHLGDVMATIGARLGAVGLVTDGAVRDVEGIRPLRFHLFALGVAPSHGTFNVLDVGVPVTVDGVRIAPGDLVHADSNGVTTVPIEIADRVYAQCRKVHEHERSLREYVIGKDFSLEGLRERVLGRRPTECAVRRLEGRSRSSPAPGPASAAPPPPCSRPRARRWWSPAAARRRSTPSSPRSPGRAAGPMPGRPTSGDPDQAAALARWTIERHGRVDILVNNAGSSSRVRNVRWVGREEWERVFAVNMTGVYALTQAVLPDMIARGGGTIVTVSSAAALRPGLLGGAPYGAAKAAVRNLMGHIHTVLRDKGIRATTILPAEVDTPILENRPLVPDARARATMMQPEDVAAAILLCVTLPPRTVVEEIVLSPTVARDLSADLAVARDLGGPTAAP